MKVTIALGGGGARGVSHIGVLERLVREGFEIKAIAGTSMGGLIGAHYACGMSPSQIAMRMAEADEVGFLRARPDGPGLIGLSAIEDWLEEEFGDLTFADLRLPFAVTATVLETGEEVILRQGRVVDALLATIAIPGIFPPRTVDGKLLVDGGVTDPVPVRAARLLSPAVCIAVALSPARKDWGKRPSPSPLNQFPVFQMVSRLKPGQALAVYLRSMEIATRNFTELRLEIDKPDFVLRPEVSHVGLLEDPPVEELIAAGALAVDQSLAQLQEAFKLPGLFSRLFSSRRSG